MPRCLFDVFFDLSTKHNTRATWCKQEVNWWTPLIYSSEVVLKLINHLLKVFATHSKTQNIHLGQIVLHIIGSFMINDLKVQKEIVSSLNCYLLMWPSPFSHRCGGRRPGSCGGLQVIGRWHRTAADVGWGAPIKSAFGIRWWLHAGSPSHPLPETGHAGCVTHRGQWRQPVTTGLVCATDTDFKPFPSHYIRYITRISFSYSFSTCFQNKVQRSSKKFSIICAFAKALKYVTKTTGLCPEKGKVSSSSNRLDFYYWWEIDPVITGCHLWVRVDAAFSCEVC